jgi:hypothetical protein
VRRQPRAIHVRWGVPLWWLMTALIAGPENAKACCAMRRKIATYSVISGRYVVRKRSPDSEGGSSWKTIRSRC